jgi:hypothetical protein
VTVETDATVVRFAFLDEAGERPVPLSRIGSRWTGSQVRPDVDGEQRFRLRIVDLAGLDYELTINQTAEGERLYMKADRTDASPYTFEDGVAL